MLIDPSDPLKHEAFVVASTAIVTAGGSVTVYVSVSTQPFTSVTTTV